MAQDDTETKTFNEETEVQGVRDNLYYFETVVFKVNNAPLQHASLWH
jgi:hypothetical protein